VVLATAQHGKQWHELMQQKLVKKKNIKVSKQQSSSSMNNS